MKPENLNLIKISVFYRMIFNFYRYFFYCLLGLVGFDMSMSNSYAQNSNCGSLQNAYGPFDYRTDKDKLDIVEAHHFTPEVEALLRGKEGYLGGDLDYVLRAFPNHHKALLATMRYGEKMKSPKPNNMNYSIECYFIRALQFRPNDTVARMLFSMFLSKNARKPEALQQLQQADQFADDNAFTHYNIGLIYFDLGEYEKALDQAHKSYNLGFTREDLKEKLKTLGKWNDSPSDSTPNTEVKNTPQPAATPSSAPIAP